MTTQKLSIKEVLVIGLMLFALFLGAGNLIFPPALGQAAGEHLWPAILGFLITGVGLPLLGIVAIGRTGNDLQGLANRVHPVFSVIFTFIMYLALGPFFGIPRTGTVAYEIGVLPFLSEAVGNNGAALFIFTIIFFSISFWLSLNPSKLVDHIGKLLTPMLLIILGFLLIKAFIDPMGTPQAPQEEYINGAFFKGFLEGYLTMDTIAALVFGIVVINTIKHRGVSSRSEITKVSIQAGIIAAVGLALVYVSLGYLGATSVDAIGIAANGGAILSGSANYLFGYFGNIVLGLAITFACITTSVGLISSCSSFFAKVLPISYKTSVFIITLFSAIVANIGLTQLISFSIPVLVAIYPLAIVLIALSFLDNLFKGRAEVYGYSLFFTGIASIVDGLKTAKILVEPLNNTFGFLPLFDLGVGWLVPAIIGAFIGYIISLFRTHPSSRLKEAN
ncbi:branched-chain amino acid transport system II carrier protein [Bacillus sp. FJAT-47783]|uniref:branched-chain amino acid transport system II carrier protein n=1 Tax=Bacillus sp. FJAT-47783 TaxID=2922712 RepID=UPI001FAE0E64|nr:branched-chain amino acid transport system II carrier protein [Bacillus sp. FJAT-47783]